VQEHHEGTRVVAVTVTFRRPDRLRALLEAVRVQSRPPDAYLVVDNGGDAALPDEVTPWAEVIRAGENTGPAGGYALGFAEAEARGADRVWVLDDDCVPDPDCLQRLRESEADVVIPRQRRTSGSEPWLPWVGGLYDVRWIERAGPPRGDYFMGAEDWELLHRWRRAGAHLERLSDTLITHDSPTRHRRGEARTWRLYYDVRNRMHFRLKVKEPTPRERVRTTVGLAKTAAAIVAFEPHKRRSLGLLWRGIRDYRAGVLGKPIDPDEWSATNRDAAAR
jgi:rhamnopyranosyl-N-acetylglucosaminyl-diphospho-decaprenol beta-1,3/1,4-galactofuranosyltransferase